MAATVARAPCAGKPAGDGPESRPEFGSRHAAACPCLQHPASPSSDRRGERLLLRSCWNEYTPAHIRSGRKPLSHFRVIVPMSRPALFTGRGRNLSAVYRGGPGSNLADGLGQSILDVYIDPDIFLATPDPAGVATFWRPLPERPCDLANPALNALRQLEDVHAHLLAYRRAR